MVSFEAASAQSASLAQRVAERTKARRAAIQALGRPGGIARVDAPERVAARIDRLTRYHPDMRPISPPMLIAEDPAALDAAGAVLERVIGTEDFVGVRYLAAGARAARAVGRVNIRDQRGRAVGYGTGSLVSPQLLLTNHHVLPDKATAGLSVVEFDYEDGQDGRPLAPVVFDLDPQRLFMADQRLDYAVVAVRATPAELARFGFTRLIEAEGKAIVGDFVTIIQHPRGEKKQVALRDNRIVDVFGQFMHYEADTEPGSSGSPVFNDQWEIVALHHASVPAPDAGEAGTFVNEGIRISRLIADMRTQAVGPARSGLVEELLDAAATGTAACTQESFERPPAAVIAPASVELDGERVTIPLELTVRAGTPLAGTVAAPGGAALSEAVTIDPDYTNREGYDPDFLGTGPLRVPLPVLADDLVAAAAVSCHATTEPDYVLPYHHFSAALNKQRRLAFFTAVNIDGKTSVRLTRERDRWSFDPRVPHEAQTGEDVYRENPLDRGHLVRRLDPAWGGSRTAAKAANDDTFHFTNCTPQHEDFNQNQTTWAGLEDYILENADNRDLRVNVFTGPVLANDDDQYRGVALPRQFWKVVTMVRNDGALSATGYVLSQEALIHGLEAAAIEGFSYGEYRTYQVPITRIQDLTRLSFGTLANADPLARLESGLSATELTRPEQIRF
jgi:endonuclease G, mitochondrial